MLTRVAAIGWVGDRIGRRGGVLIGTVFGILGAALMAGSQNASMFICARVIAGIGIGFMNAIILPWVSELSQSHDRGSSFSLVFVANYLGIVIAYWINFGIRNSNLEFRWRFPLAWMIIPLLVVDVAVPLLPESPRFVYPSTPHPPIRLYILHAPRGWALELL